LQNAVKKFLGDDIVDEAAIKEFVRDLQRTLTQADVNMKLVLSATESVQRRALEEKPAGLSMMKSGKGREMGQFLRRAGGQAPDG